MAATWAYLLAFCLQAAVSLCLFHIARTKTSAVSPCCLSTSLSTCWQCLHTQPVVLIWELEFVRLSHVWGFLLTGVHLLVGTSHDCVHTSACGASPLYSSAFVHLCFSIRLPLTTCNTELNKKGEDRIVNTPIQESGAQGHPWESSSASLLNSEGCSRAGRGRS